jgi:hypothetical protein
MISAVSITATMSHRQRYPPAEPAGAGLIASEEERDMWILQGVEARADNKTLPERIATGSSGDEAYSTPEANGGVIPHS